MGNIHTKRRNRLHHEKVHDIATVAMDLDAQHRAAGLTRKRAKRHFDVPRPAPALRSTNEPDTADSDPLPDPPDELTGGDCDADFADEVDSMDEDEQGACNMTALAARFTQAVDDDVDEIESAENEQELPEPAALVAQQCNPQTRRVRLFFSRAHVIPLSETFNFSESVQGVEDGLGVFWKGAIHNLGKERDVYMAIASERE
jgi:hypothetical protein